MEPRIRRSFAGIGERNEPVIGLTLCDAIRPYMPLMDWRPTSGSLHNMSIPSKDDLKRSSKWLRAKSKCP
jgi:hypothetical protein